MNFNGKRVRFATFERDVHPVSVSLGKCLGNLKGKRFIFLLEFQQKKHKRGCNDIVLSSPLGYNRCM